MNNNELILNAIKNGNVASIDPKSICFGRDEEISFFENILEDIEDDDISVTKFICGEYGSGKSFLLKVIEHMAYNKGFVVATVVLNKSVQMHKIDTIYKDISANITAPTGKGLKHIIDRWYGKLEKDAQVTTDDIRKRNQYIRDNIEATLIDAREYSNSFAEAVKYYAISLSSQDTEVVETANKAMAWLTGDRNILFKDRHKFGVKGDVDKENAFDYLKALSSFLSAVGYNGLVILFDEAISIVDGSRTESIRNSAFEYIQLIYDGCNKELFDSSLFIFAGTPKFFTDNKKGLKTYPSLYDRIKPSFSEEVEDIKQPIIRLKKLKPEDFEEFGNMLIKLHEESNNWDFSPYHDDLSKIYKYLEYKASLSEGHVLMREFGKTLIDYLDALYQNPNQREQLLSELRSTETKQTHLDDEWAI